MLLILTSARNCLFDYIFFTLTRMLEYADLRVEHKEPEAGVVNFHLHNSSFHTRYLMFVESFGRTGLMANVSTVGAYVGHASPSNGDEGIGPEVRRKALIMCARHSAHHFVVCLRM